MFSNDEFKDGLLSGLVNHDPDVSLAHQPQLVLNDFSSGRKTLEFVLDNINSCDSFVMAIAFVTRSGVACLHQALKDFGARGGTGEILVSTYLNFSDPQAIQVLSSFDGIKVSFVRAPNFHGKTYLFENKSYAQIMIGSSNLTQNALGKNTEVNLTVSALRKSRLYQQTLSELNHWKKSAEEVDFASLQVYKEKWENENLRKNKELLISVDIPSEGKDFSRSPDSDVLSPNPMQEEALEKLISVRRSGHDRSLIISATGTGKTVLAALDAKQFKAKKLLFVVHRLNIAKKAIHEFKRVFGKSISTGIYSGSNLNKDADFIFSTVQTINTDRHLQEFSPNEFDYIIIDETHRAGAATYKRVIEYFHPKFLLGMTATPERTDGFDIFSLFNHSIAYEIRLQKAMDADLLSPFHYFGVIDLTVDGESLDESSDFNKLVSNDRIEHIINNLTDYGCDSGVVRGLIFCSKVEEAKELSLAFNKRGYKSVSLSGEDAEQNRENAIRRLESDGQDKLDYLFTVDIFNEGVDIPRVNQIVMLRPTTSAIIFIQQLGRGLRKAQGKEYVTIIDFIGNYKNNYLIPIALYGDTSHDKDKLRRLLNAGSSLIPGASSISFEKIARDRIFASIDKKPEENKEALEALKKDFELMKFRLGRLPMMMDFILHEARDPFQYVNYSDSFLAFTEKEFEKSSKVDSSHLKLLKYFSKSVCNGVRLEEGVILNGVLSNSSINVNYIKKTIRELTGFDTDRKAITSAIHNLNLHFSTTRVNKKEPRVSEVTGFQIIEYDSVSGNVTAGETIKECINCITTKSYMIDLALSSNAHFLKDFSRSNFVNGFKRGGKYNRESIFRILQWDKKPNPGTVFGYKRSPDESNCPIFLTYKKAEDISESIKYEDYFKSPRHIVYMSKNRRDMSSPDVKAIYDHNELGMRLPLFVKKNDDEGNSFYYLGELSAIQDRFIETTMSGEKIVKMEFMIDKEIDHRLYKYLIS